MPPRWSRRLTGEIAGPILSWEIYRKFRWIQLTTPWTIPIGWMWFLTPRPCRKKVGWRMDSHALPINERGHVCQDRDGHEAHEGTLFLRPSYHGLLEDTG